MGDRTEIKPEFDSSGQPVKRSRGGRRPGAGRPAGSRNALPREAVSAIRGLRHRVPAGTPEPLADVADEAFERIVAVMRGEVKFDATAVLKAAATARDEVCGKVTDKLEHSGGITVEIREQPARVPTYSPDPSTSSGT